MLLHAPSRKGLVILIPVGCLARTLKRTSLGATFRPPRGPAGLIACLSPIEKWVLLGPVARSPDLLFSSFVAELSPTERSLEQGAVLNGHSVSQSKEIYQTISMVTP